MKEKYICRKCGSDDVSQSTKTWVNATWNVDTQEWDWVPDLDYGRGPIESCGACGSERDLLCVPVEFDAEKLNELPLEVVEAIYSEYEHLLGDDDDDVMGKIATTLFSPELAIGQRLDIWVHKFDETDEIVSSYLVHGFQRDDRSKLIVRPVDMDDVADNGNNQHLYDRGGRECVDKATFLANTKGFSEVGYFVDAYRKHQIAA